VTSPAAIREALQMTAQDLGPAGWDPEYGWGVVDAQAALEYGIAHSLTTSDAAGLVDLTVFTQHWLATGTPSPLGDLNGDHRVDFDDFALLADRWRR
jgi:hypothetical protein